MEVTELGQAGLFSSVIGLGTAAFAGLHGAVSRHECVRVMDVALHSGITMLDTADFYARGDVERLLGESLEGRRDSVLIATHGGGRASADGTPVSFDGRPSYLATACEASLRRLKTDYIDLYYLSRVDPRVPVEESVGKLAELQAEGKIRYLGLCEVTADELRRAHAIQPISALAVDYSLRDRAAETEVLAVAHELGVGVVAYCPLARGLLAGVIPPASTQEHSGLRAIEAEAAALDIGMARLALAWLSGCRQVIPVPSSRSPAHLEMNASAIGIRLSAQVCARLETVFPPQRPGQLGRPSGDPGSGTTSST
ncbi:MAG TPA: aldo/keto reductase [Streptosporangiaceae bacterium]|nr:aldo/keto reductase [Streptosporangiaceae bacterium]